MMVIGCPAGTEIRPCVDHTCVRAESTVRSGTSVVTELTISFQPWLYVTGSEMHGSVPEDRHVA